MGHGVHGSELHPDHLGPPVTTSVLDVDAAEARGPVARRGALAWSELSTAAHVYVTAVIAAGIIAVVAWLPTSLSEPWLFVLLLITSCLTSLWKLNLPIPLASGSTLSVCTRRI